MKASAFIAAMEADGCHEVGGPRYCMQLYALCESVQARRALEIGLGWGYSGRAFAASMSQREPSVLTSIDPAPARKDYEYDDAANWRIVQDFSESARFDGNIDLLYLDGDPRSVSRDFDRFYRHLLPGGIVIIDGYGHNDGDTVKAVDSLRRSFPFTVLPYSPDWAHAVHRKVV